MARKKRKNEMALELVGHVNIVTRKGGHVKREKLDGGTVLQCVLFVLERALDEHEK